MRKFIDFLIEIKLRVDRGNALFIWFRNIIIIVAGLKFIVEISIAQSIGIGLLIALFFYFLGWIDMNKIGFLQREQEIATEKYNYYFAKLKEKFK